jgi:hypothetical protein
MANDSAVVNDFTKCEWRKEIAGHKIQATIFQAHWRQPIARQMAVLRFSMRWGTATPG